MGFSNTWEDIHGIRQEKISGKACGSGPLEEISSIRKDLCGGGAVRSQGDGGQRQKLGADYGASLFESVQAVDYDCCCRV